MIARSLVHLTYPLHERLKGQRTVAAFRESMSREYWSARELEAHQIASLRSVLVAAQGAEYYRNAFAEAGFSPDRLASPADLQRLPFLTKAVIRERRDALVTPGDPDRLVPFSTGGSSGEPVRFFVDRGRIASEWAACWRARSWWGLDWTDRWFWLWGSPIELTGQGRLKIVRDFALNRRLLSAFDLTDASMARYARLIRRDRPAYLYAYASAAFMLARYIVEKGLEIPERSLKVIFTTADTLYPDMRRTIEQAFGCPVAVEYGSRDGGFIAHQCPAGGLHVHADRVIVEIVRGDRVAEPGEMGEVVLTSLDATAMPFIRYRTGDVAAWSDRPCVCGRRLPTLASIEGRASDFLLARDMRLIHGESITHIVREIDGIAAFRVIQEEVDRLELQVVSLRPEELPRERIESKIQKLFGYPVTVRFTLLQALPRLASGKHRVVVSDLTGRYFEQAGAPA